MAKRRGTETVGDMVRSMALVLVAVAFVAGFVGLVRPSSPTVRDVDYTDPLERARDAAAFEVLAPASLPDGWTVTRAAYQAGESEAEASWRMSIVTADETYIGIVQQAGEADRIIERELPGAEPDGSSTVQGQQWTRLIETGERDPDRALLLEQRDSVVLVVGSGDYPELEEFVASLR
jgi:hypothetical protein